MEQADNERTTRLVQIGETDPLGRQAIERLLAGGACASAIYYELADSTNSLALRESPTADNLPRLTVADRQAAGRGRLGRPWYADSGTLTFSIRLSLPWLSAEQRCWIALAAGMGVADAAAHQIAPVQPAIKWPNDVYIADKKVAGLLVEANNHAAVETVIGVGLNVTTDLSLAPPDVQTRATSLHLVTTGCPSRYAILPTVVQQLLERLQQLEQDPAGLLNDFRRRCYLTGRSVRIAQPNRVIAGRVIGVQDDGSLAVATESGVESIHAGEIQVNR